MTRSPYTPPRAHVARGISVFAILVGMVCSGFTALPDASNQDAAVAAPPQVEQSPQAAARNALAAVTPRPVPTTPSRPAPGLIEASKPLGTPAPLTEPSSAYKFLETNRDGSAVAYDPCRPIHYVTNGAKQPANGPQLVKEALAAVSQATGLVFVDDGGTTEPGGFQRKAFQPERYGDRWAPVLIAWVDQSDQPDAAGKGHSQSFGLDGSNAIYETGEVDISVNPINSDGFELAVLKHEFGHLVGLAHEAGQAMDGSTGRRASEYLSEYQAGDLTGLSILGQGKCLGF